MRRVDAYTRRSPELIGAIGAEANLAAEAHSAQAEARLYGSDGDEGRTRHHPPPARARTRAPGRLTFHLLGAASPTPRQEISPTTSGTRRLDRLRRPQDFLAALREGRRGRHRLLGLAVRCNGLVDTRVGYAVGKRVGTAVVRNRVKRRLREIMRATPLIPGHDIVVTAYPDAAGATFDELRDAVLTTARRARVLDADRLDARRPAGSGQVPPEDTP